MKDDTELRRMTERGLAWTRGEIHVVLICAAVLALMVLGVWKLVELI